LIRVIRNTLRVAFFQYPNAGSPAAAASLNFNAEIVTNEFVTNVTRIHMTWMGIVAVSYQTLVTGTKGPEIGTHRRSLAGGRNYFGRDQEERKIE
jgi:hypothetical protein